MADIPERNRNYFRFALTEINLVRGTLETRSKSTIDVAEKSGLGYDLERLARASRYIKQGLEEETDGATDTKGTTEATEH